MKGRGFRGGLDEKMSGWPSSPPWPLHSDPWHWCAYLPNQIGRSLLQLWYNYCLQWETCRKMFWRRISSGLISCFSHPSYVHPWNHLWIVWQIDPSSIPDQNPLAFRFISLQFISLQLIKGSLDGQKIGSWTVNKEQF